MIPSGKDSSLEDKVRALKMGMMGDDWLYRRGKHVDERIVKVRSGLEVVQRIHKATGGLIRAEFFVEDGRFEEVTLSGDYFCFPKNIVNLLEEAIAGSQVKEIATVVTDFYKTKQFELPGVEIDDWNQLFKI